MQIVILLNPNYFFSRLTELTTTPGGNSMTIDFLTSEQRIRTKETLVVQTNQLTGKTSSHHNIQQQYDETDLGDELRMVLRYKL